MIQLDCQVECNPMTAQTKIHTDLNSRSLSALPFSATSANRWSICTCYTLYILNICNVYVDFIVYTIYHVYTMYIYIYSIYHVYSFNMYTSLYIPCIYMVYTMNIHWICRPQAYPLDIPSLVQMDLFLTYF